MARSIASRAAALREKGLAALRRHLVNAKGRRIQVLMESAAEAAPADFTPVQIEARGGPECSTRWSAAMTAVL